MSGPRGFLLCWPSEGRPCAFFESDGRGFLCANLADDDEEWQEAADDALVDAVEWGKDPSRPLPAGWRVALPWERP